MPILEDYQAHIRQLSVEPYVPEEDESSFGLLADMPRRPKKRKRPLEDDTHTGDTTPTTLPPVLELNYDDDRV